MVIATAIAATRVANPIFATWTKVASDLEHEERAIEAKDMNVKTPTTIAVYAAASAIKMDPHRVLWAIRRYAERNTLTHSTVNELIQAGHFSALAELLYNDLKDLSRVIPPNMEGDIEHMSAVIDSLKAKYFIIEEGDEDNPEAWVRNEEASKYRLALRTKSEDKERKKAELAKEMAKRAQDVLRKKAIQAEQIERAIEGKRKASQPFPAGEALLAKKVKHMEKVVGIQAQVEKREIELDKLYKMRDSTVEGLAESGIDDEAISGKGKGKA